AGQELSVAKLLDELTGIKQVNPEGYKKRGEGRQRHSRMPPAVTLGRGAGYRKDYGLRVIHRPDS
ncbi:MAG: hypothetical protein ACOCSQ_05375, partial [Planctomycetota bacterium]